MSRLNEFHDDEIYPITASESGTNAYYIPTCSVVGHQPSFAACLKRCADRKNGRLNALFSDCSVAIGRKECPAMPLRQEELLAGKAIYFINRIKLREHHNSLSQASQYSPSLDRSEKKSKRSAAPAVAPPAHFLDIGGGNYADALNASLKSPPLSMPSLAPKIKPVVQAKPVEHAKPTYTAPVAAGMSLIQMARMQLAAKSQSLQGA